MKQTFNIPDGCSTVTVEQVGNQLITTFEPEKYIPKKGDCVKMQYNDISVPTFCFINETENGRIFAKNAWIKAKNDFNVVLFEDSNFFAYDSIEKITPEQFQSEFEKLGYVYDFETNTASKSRWRAKVGDYYFKLDSYFNPMKLQEFNDKSDALNYLNFNYFETEEISTNAAKFLKQRLKEFNNK